MKPASASLVGLDRQAAKEALAGFMSGKTMSANQIEFVPVSDPLFKGKNAIVPLAKGDGREAAGGRSQVRLLHVQSYQSFCYRPLVPNPSSATSI